MFVVLSQERDSGEHTCHWLRSHGYEATWESLSQPPKPAPAGAVILCMLESVDGIERWANFAPTLEEHMMLLWLGTTVVAHHLELVLSLPADMWLFEGEPYNEHRLALALKRSTKGEQEHHTFKRAVSTSVGAMMTQLRQLRRLLPSQALGVEVRRVLEELLVYGERLEAQTQSSAPAKPSGPGLGVESSVSVEVAPALKRVLIIDDEPQMLRALSRLLGQRCEVHTAEGGEAAVEHLEGGLDVDAILCDLMMPGLSGPDFYEVLCRRWPHLEPRVIFVTGGGVGSWVQAFEERMSARIIYKPLTRDVLLQRIDQVAQSPGVGVP